MQTTPLKLPPAHKSQDKILVTVRVRPLNARELAQKDVSAWDCVDDKTIVYKPPSTGPLLPDRSPHHGQNPKSYAFDKVFGPESVTESVYAEGAKGVALSVLSGLNATIFAYGQTSSGKTFTMRGITDLVVQDIYSYIQQHSERDFVIKVSALEIYNEVVKDLLNADWGPLRLLDDPEKGTIVEKLVEEIIQDRSNLRQILAIVEAQRQVGETMLNDASSRSHQIIRLTVESSPRTVPDGELVKCLVASLNLVDLAGSERASQTHAEGARLKEGCHINRSLLTLTTIIRKLSGQGRTKNAHLPYRDSKLTRILQNSLGGNARTAIICTMSPAHTHLEQSRNTLFFATHAKEVTNTAQVNMVVSDKAMVKLLQKEVARLESELRGGSEMQAASLLDTEALLIEKDAEIQQLRAEVKELHYQRDLVQSRLDEALQRLGNETLRITENENRLPSPLFVAPCMPGSPSATVDIADLDTLQVDTISTIINVEDETVPKEKSPPVAHRQSTMRHSITRQSSLVSMMLVQEIKKLEQLQDELGEDANRAMEALQKEVECLRLAQAGMNQDAAVTIAKLQDEINALKLSKIERVARPFPQQSIGGTSIREEISRLQAMSSADRSNANATIATLEQQLDNVQKSINNLVLTSNESPQEEHHTVMKGFGDGEKQNSIPYTAWENVDFDDKENNENSLLDNGRRKATRNYKTQFTERVEFVKTSKDSTAIPHHQRTNSVDIKKMQNMFKMAAEENIQSIRAYVTELKERVAKLQYQKQLLVCQVLELEANGGGLDEDDGDLVLVDEEEESAVEPVVLYSPKSYESVFQEQRMQIVGLWDACQVSIIHRSQFYLLFKGDPADKVYLEVELRRLAWLQDHFVEECSPLHGDGSEESDVVSLAASARALKKEREQLAKRMRHSLTEEEREEVYQRWGVGLDAKQRKLQVAYRVWTDPHDVNHIEDSAALVARIVGFWNPNRRGASKEMFELAFAPPSSKKPWLPAFNWNAILNNLNALNV